MPSRWIVQGSLLATLIVPFGSACTGSAGGPGPGTEHSDVVPIPEVPEDLVKKSWLYEVADDDTRQPFENDSWNVMLTRRDYKEGVKAFGPGGGMHTARAHADAANLFRQAFLTSSYALVSNYDTMKRAYDPIGVAHLLSVSYAGLGDLDKAREWSAKLDGADKDPTVPWHAPWKTWLAQDAPSFPPDLSKLPFKLPPVAPGTWPEVPKTPYYQLRERKGSEYSVDASDHSVLLALALWHEKAAVAAGADKKVVDTYLAHHRLPGEAHDQELTDLPLVFLFGGDSLVPADGRFLAAVSQPGNAAAIDTFKDTSLLAWAASASRIDGKINAERGNDVADKVRDALQAEMEDYSGGERAYHRIFVAIAKAAILRALSESAMAEGDIEVAGKLRLSAYDHSLDEASVPEDLLAHAAWDASNGNPMRAAEIVHNLTRRYPALEVTRFAIDVLGLRAGNEERGVKAVVDPKAPAPKAPAPTEGG